MFVDVETLTGNELVIPRQLAGIGIERQHRIGVEERHSVFLATALAVPGLRLGRAPVGHVKNGIVGAGDPGIAAAAAPFFRRESFPGLAPWLTRLRGGLGP